MKSLNVFITILSVYVLSNAGPNLPLAWAGRGGGDAGGQAMAPDSQGRLQSVAAGGYISTMKLVFKEYQEIYLIPQNVEEKVKSIIDRFPISKYKKNELFKGVMATRDQFIDIKTINPELLKKLKTDYDKMIKNLGRTPPKDYQFPAYSMDGLTFILSPLFDDANRMTVSQQALILIHEYFVREMKHLPFEKRLQLANQFDVHILKLLNGSNDPEEIFKFNYALFKLKEGYNGFVSLEDLRRDRLLRVQNQGKPMLLSDFIPTPADFHVNTESLSYLTSQLYGERKLGRNVIPSLVQKKFEAISPGISEIFEKATIGSLNSKVGQFTEHDFEDMAGLCAQFGHVLKESRYEKDALLFVSRPVSDYGRQVFAVQCSEGRPFSYDVAFIY